MGACRNLPTGTCWIRTVSSLHPGGGGSRPPATGAWPPALRGCSGVAAVRCSLPRHVPSAVFLAAVGLVIPVRADCQTNIGSSNLLHKLPHKKPVVANWRGRRIMPADGSSGTPPPSPASFFNQFRLSGTLLLLAEWAHVP